MVYRGKPSAGCENCRKAKKRCGLEKPACERCVKLNKICSGYRDTTSLQIQDETKSVKLKAERRAAKVQWQSPARMETVSGILTPAGSTDSDSSTPSDTTTDLDMYDEEATFFVPSDTTFGGQDMSAVSLVWAIKPKPDDVATNYFYNQFTSNNHWEFMRGLYGSKMDPCLELAIKACGMAALHNIENVVMGKDYARSMYAEALGMLNEQLRDPKRCKTDASLIAVSMLGYFENLMCEGRESIQSWKAHVKGATQLIRLRGKGQFDTQIGRILFREIRAQVMIQCLWDDEMPPDLLWDYQSELDAHDERKDIVGPVDTLTRVCLDFAILRCKMRTKEVSNAVAAQQASELERQFIQWQIDTTRDNPRWRYETIEVADAEHVWNGTVHAYQGHPAPTAWNTYRNMRIMLSRTQEWLCHRFHFSDSEREEQVQYFRRTRRQMTDDICASIPVQLGHASPAYSSPCTLITAYGSIWPLFFAGTCAFERIGMNGWSLSAGEPRLIQTSAASAQAMWILKRLEYISEKVGLKWADGVAATLRGDFHVYDNLLENSLDEQPPTREMWAKRAPWLTQVEKAGRGPRFLIEKPSPLSDALAEESEERKMARGPIWLGKDAMEDMERKSWKSASSLVECELPP